MPNSKERIVFFDFCGTLVPFQSAPRYINFVVDNYPRKAARCRRKVRTLLEKLHMPHRVERFTRGLIKRKEIELWPLKGYTEDVLRDAAKRFYVDVIKPNLIPEVLREYTRYQKEGYRIVLVSGGFGIYLQYFAEGYGIGGGDLISSNIQIKRGRATGKLEGVDCMGENKVKLLEQRFDRKKIFSEAVSDSYSDMPLLKWVDRGIVVAQIPTWNKDYNLGVIYWK